MKQTDLYYEQQTEPNKSCLLALRELILQHDVALTESLKWSIPCFSFHNRMCCFLNIDKKTSAPYLLMVEGHLLKHATLEQGNRSRMKIFRIDPNEDLPVEALTKLLNEMLDLYNKGTIKIKQTQ